ncbi:phytanoyl-CoA dioxygenase protein [Rhizobium sp. Kim5]|uniref:phytanoyl-CoA dioxygenase family protein n=1 Tax=Rhizobium sp. Kim5 TaxID=2020311 RepID=UPI000A2A273B|nr:phytanoyl-CoA dioxygenase family protein [Rhizobium sp. Kim5]ARQ57008.1 phytanoyl-CoA dioxygenase protein [Rhizobium sp. Kim5]
MTSIASYGIKEQLQSSTAIDHAVEQIRLLGYAVVDGGYSPEEIATFGKAFDAARTEMEARHGGRARLEAIDEHNTIRLPMLYNKLFLQLAMNDNITELCGRLLSDYFVLNQQNGISNPGSAARYNQGAYHRDLPFQHFTSSRPLAINALYCIDDFTTENGATFVIPASHKQEPFPSDAMVNALQLQVPARAGSFIVLDCMTYHTGGVNHTQRERRAVNHVYTIPLLKQQIDFPAALKEDFTNDQKARRLLGYGLSIPTDVQSYYRSRISE